MDSAKGEAAMITCIFYSHAWAVQMLEHAAIGELGKTLVVEVSINSILASVFNDARTTRVGVAGLLRSDTEVSQIAEQFSGFASSIILASRPPVPVASTASGIGVLKHAEHGYQHVVLMVHLSEAATMIHAVAEADRFGVLWDLADTPNVALADLGVILARHNCLSDESWAGLHFYAHPRRKVADAAERKARYETIFAEYPALLTRDS
jgi:hypothetical protein